jgi:hypothetical protein
MALTRMKTLLGTFLAAGLVAGIFGLSRAQAYTVKVMGELFSPLVMYQ